MLSTVSGSTIILAVMKPPCDKAVIRSRPAIAPCPPNSGPWILAAAILGTSMAFIDSTVVNVALPALQSSLGATVIDAQWVVESYALFLGALILVGGSVGDLLGRRRIFVAGVVVFAIASAWCGLAPNIDHRTQPSRGKGQDRKALAVFLEMDLGAVMFDGRHGTSFP